MDTDEAKNTKNELKIIVIGNSNTGKTSFVNKWTKGTFTDFYKATVVSEFSYKIFQYKEKFYRIGKVVKSNHNVSIKGGVFND